jgi:hypothetical protein
VRAWFAFAYDDLGRLDTDTLKNVRRRVASITRNTILNRPKP